MTEIVSFSNFFDETGLDEGIIQSLVRQPGIMKLRDTGQTLSDEAFNEQLGEVIVELITAGFHPRLFWQDVLELLGLSRVK